MNVELATGEQALVCLGQIERRTSNEKQTKIRNVSSLIKLAAPRQSQQDRDRSSPVRVKHDL
jgi:hypothetical protein